MNLRNHFREIVCNWNNAFFDPADHMRPHFGGHIKAVFAVAGTVGPVLAISSLALNGIDVKSHILSPETPNFDAALYGITYVGLNVSMAAIFYALGKEQRKVRSARLQPAI